MEGRSAVLTAVTGDPPLQAPLAMYRFGGFAQAPLSSCPSDEFPLISLPCGPKALVDVPFLSAGCDFLRMSRGKKTGSRATFLSLEIRVWGQATCS